MGITHHHSYTLSAPENGGVGGTKMEYNIGEDKEYPVDGIYLGGLIVISISSGLMGCLIGFAIAHLLF
jgi:hypothetical protein